MFYVRMNERPDEYYSQCTSQQSFCKFIEIFLIFYERPTVTDTVK